VNPAYILLAGLRRISLGLSYKRDTPFMTYKTLLLASIATAAAFSAVPASAAPILFELSGGKTATFTIDSATAPDFANISTFGSLFIGNQLGYNGVTGIFGGAPQTAAINFGTNLVAAFQISGTTLGFTQYAGPASDLFSFDSNLKPTFNFGTYALSSITSGAATLKISAGAVPEPATWAMMLAGFGGMGFAMRRSRTRTNVSFA